MFDRNWLISHFFFITDDKVTSKSDDNVEQITEQTAPEVEDTPVETIKIEPEVAEEATEVAKEATENEPIDDDMEKESSETVQGAEALPQETEKFESEMSEPIKIPLVSKVTDFQYIEYFPSAVFGEDKTALCEKAALICSHSAV